MRYAAQPLMHLNLLVRRPVTVGTLLVLVATVLMITVFFLGSYLQRYCGYDALQTGLLFLPVALATMAGATFAGRVLARLGPRLLGAAGLLVGGIGMGVAATVDGPTAMVAAISLAAAGTSPAGFSRAFTTKAVAALAAIVTIAVAPGRQAPSSPAGVHRDERAAPAGRRRRRPGPRPDLAQGIGRWP